MGADNISVTEKHEHLWTGRSSSHERVQTRYIREWHDTNDVGARYRGSREREHVRLLPPPHPPLSSLSIPNPQLIIPPKKVRFTRRIPRTPPLQHHRYIRISWRLLLFGCRGRYNPHYTPGLKYFFDPIPYPRRNVRFLLLLRSKTC